jgi:vacuolar-type H+-ATPase subunit H
MLATSKNQADGKILAAAENQADGKILAAAENQADGKILAAAENQEDGKILAARENQADDRILAGVEISAPSEKPVFAEKRDWKSKQPAYCLGSTESPTADFSLVPLMSTFSSS